MRLLRMASFFMFKGSFVALVTPMDGAGRIELDAMEKLVRFHLDRGTGGLVVAGTTGESSALTTREFTDLVSTVCRVSAGAIPVVAGTGTANTAKSIKMTRLAAELGADAALVVTPYYNRPMQSGLEAHFEAVADASEIPVIMYNVPARTSVDMLSDTTARLAEHPMIAGIKEAKPDMQRVRRLIDKCPEDFCVMSGDDGSCMGAMLLGASGVISVAANVVPDRMHRLCTEAMRGAKAVAEKDNDGLRELFGLLAIESNPIPVKWAAHQLGLIGSGIRLPLLPLEARHHDELRACLDRLRAGT